MPRVMHFEINADDPVRAAKFYEEVFGWKINKWDGPADYWLIDSKEDDGDEPGINGAIMKRMMPDLHTVNTITVDNIDEFATIIMEADGRIVKPKMVIPGVGYLCYCRDTEGNI